MRTRVVIQSRLNSSRLPGKALMSIAGMPLIELVARRSARSGHEVIVATSQEHYDSRIADHLTSVGIPVMRGDLDDVLARFVQATADLEPDDRVVRLTGDNPVQDAAVVDELLAAMDASGHDYGRVDIDVTPEGLGAEAFWVRDLRRAAQSATDPYDREHVTPWLRRTLGELLFAPTANPGEPLRFRCTVDNLDDFDRVSGLFAQVQDPVAAPWTDLIDLLAAQVRADGPTVPSRTVGSTTLSAVTYGGAHLSGAGAPSAAQARTMLRQAVSRGITRLEVGREDAAARRVRGAVEPQLTQRLGYLIRLDPLAATDAAAVEARVEASFADLGRRSADAVLLGQLSDATGTAWQRLREYVAAGEVGRSGVVLSGLDQIPAALQLSGAGHLQAAFNLLTPLPADLADQVRAAGVPLSTYGTFGGGDLLTDPRLAPLAAELGRDGADDLCLAYVLGHDVVTTAVLGHTDATQVIRNADLAARPPLTADQIALVDAALA